MESDLPVPIDDSITYKHSIQEEEDEEPEEIYSRQEEPRYYYQPQPPPVYMMPPQPPSVQQNQKKDIFSELDRIHWIIFVATVLLAFFMGKSISTPIILRSS
jgi:hypothetical protein